MARSGGSMHDELRLEFPYAYHDRRAIPHIKPVVTEVRVRFLEPALVPARIGARAEEVGSHVVVTAMHAPLQVAKITHDDRRPLLNSSGNSFHAGLQTERRGTVIPQSCLR